MSAHRELKAATRAAHELVDSSFASYDLADDCDYRRFLERHAAAFLPAEQALAEAGADRVIGGWGKYRRTDALVADLAELGIAVPAMRAAPAYDSGPAILGGVYVLEGSRLGGAMLRRSVGSGFPRRFLDSVHPAGRWRALVAQLDTELSDPLSLKRATDSALGTFAMFA